MGNAAPTAPDMNASIVFAENEDYQWPESLFDECRDMADASFLMYTFSYLLHVARKSGLQGLTLDKKGRPVQTEFSPDDVGKIVMDNADALQKAFPDEFGKPGLIEESLFRMQKRMSMSNANTNGAKYPLSLQHFDDTHQQHEMVFAVAKDATNKRITVAFRGTDNELSMSTNWSTNLSVLKTYVDFPTSLKEKMAPEGEEGMYVHSGFYNYLFEKTFEDSDDPDKRKYDEVLEHVEALASEYPTYKIYVTGHSLGGAMSSLIAFFLACESDLPKPISCINFAAPRVGDSTFLEASQKLEEEGALRICRVVNDKDTVPFMPMFNYSHVGFQVRLYDSATYEPEVTYPKILDSWYSRFGRTYGNSLMSSFNLSYDHGEYRERVVENKEALKMLNLNDMYADTALTGLSPASNA